MLQMRSILTVADNSGAKKIRLIGVLGGNSGTYAHLGDVVTASVQEANADSTIKKGAVVKAVIVWVRNEQRRRDGTYITFDENAAVLISAEGNPVGTRVFGPVARELRDAEKYSEGFRKILSLAPEVL